MGTAKVTFSFDAWKEGLVAPSTIELPVVKPQPKEQATASEESDE